MSCRIHITGGSGSGTTTLGAHLALAMDAPHVDADDYFWMPTDPPYRDKRPVVDRIALLRAVVLERPNWVLSGSVMGWDDSLTAQFDLVVRLEVPPDVRLARLAARQTLAYGDRILPGGDMEDGHNAFIEWAKGYDDANFAGRNSARHVAWCASLSCPVITLDSTTPVEGLVTACLQKIATMKGDA